MQSLRLKRIRDQVLESLYQTPRAAIVEKFLGQGAGVYVLGGAVRDSIAFDLGHRDWAPRDFDIGVTGIETQEFDYVLSAFGQKNRHGGYALKEQGLPTWDVWRLENSVGLRKTCTPFSLENVLRSFNLDCNAIAMNVRTEVFTDAGAVESVRRRRLSFVSHAIKHSRETFAAKALLTQLRFGYSMSAELQHLVETHLDHGVFLYESRKVFLQLPSVSPINAGAGSSPVS